jgi:NAD(P)-dependent dehydrogenase (short-subunit alcohol dehydrogenase family)
MMMESQKVIVTGGATSIGLAIAERFLCQGARVHVCDVNPKAVAEAIATHPGLTGTVANVGVPAEVEKLVAEAYEHFGGYVDVLVNNVGIGGAHKQVEHIGYDEWDTAMRVNIGGAFYGIKNVVPVMKKRRHGAIINISTASVRSKPRRRSDYNTSKAALEELSASLARELGPFDIRCNVIRPGVMDNARMRGICEKYAAEQGRTADEVEQDYLRYVSMHAKILPAEIGDTCVFLAGEQARHITGQIVSVCGNLEWEG